MRSINRIISILLIVMIGLSTGLPNYGQEIRGNKTAIDYLKSVQNTDGGFPSVSGQKSSPATTAWVAMGLKAAGQDLNVNAWKPGGKSPAEYLQGANVSFDSLNDYSRFTLACSAMGIKPELNGENMLKKLKTSQLKNGQFSFADEANDKMINVHIWAVLAIYSTKNVPNDKVGAQKWLLDAQNKDGGYGWYVGASSDPDDTAAAIQALIVLGEKPSKSSAIKNALSYIKTTKNKDGGYGLMGVSNAASDAWVIQGFIASGLSTVDAKAHLMSLQEKSGAFKWREDASSSPVMMTAYALTALSDRAHPVNQIKLVK